MPSPFPGMDPYLENPRFWRDVHHSLISGIREMLSDRLRPNYVVRVEDRVYLTDESDPGQRAISPDVKISQARHPASSPTSLSLPEMTTEPFAIMTMVDEEIREARLHILEVPTRRVVTVIEVLSPTNKIGGAHGRKSYVAKRREVMKSDAHFVEIDLLRRGRRFYTDPRLPAHDYSVHVSNAASRPTGLVWTIGLRDRLPVVAIPVLPQHPSAPLDLQAVLTSAYDHGGYDIDLDHRKPPVPPLKGEWAEWSDRLLREKGLR